MSTTTVFSRRKFLAKSSAAAAVGLGGYAFGVEPRWVAVDEQTLPIPGLPDALNGTKAVQISDLHVGSRVPEQWLRQQFEFIDSIEPEFIFFTGDYLDDGSEWHLKKGLRLLQYFPRGTIGNACVLGNHDFSSNETDVSSYAANTDRLIEGFQDAGLNLLLDESVSLGGLQIAGLRDLWHGGFNDRSAAKAIASVAPVPSLVLSHNPDTADHPIWDGFRSWVLCGHTHGGQCRFPIIGAPILPVRNREYVAGKYAHAKGHRIYINRGLGHTRRVRFMSRPEITVFTLVAEKTTAEHQNLTC